VRPIRCELKEAACFAPVSAGYLKATRWFALDARAWKEGNKPRFRLDEDTGEIVVEAPNGLRYVGFDRPVKPSDECVDFREFWARGPAPKEARLGDAEVLRKALIAVEKDRSRGEAARAGVLDVKLRALDDEGLQSVGDARTLLALREFVRTWRQSAVVRDWDDPTAFLPMDTRKLDEIVADAMKQPAKQARLTFVDLTAPPGGRTAKVAGYAVRALETPEARRVKVLVGSSDAVRVWVNGELVLKSLSRRVARPDQDSAAVELRKGSNTVVVEVSQADGDWGFYFRVEDEKTGRKLRVGGNGEMVPLPGTKTRN
jgi:hypothetical protein